MVKTRIIGLVVAIAAGFAIAGNAHAFMAKSGDSVYIAKDEVVSSTLFAAGSSITVDGKVQGDVICAGQSIVINGLIDGDVLCAGQTITVNGTVNGSVRGAGNTITIAGKVARNVTVAGAAIIIAPTAQVGWDLLFAGATTEMRGVIKRDMEGAGANVTLAGTVGRNAELWVDEQSRKNEMNKDKQSSALTVTSDAAVVGSLTYTSRQEANIDSKANIKGGVTKHEPMISKEHNTRNAAAGWIWFKIISILSAVIVGLILISWLNRPLRGVMHMALKKPGASIGWGIIVFILTPIIALILMVTVIGIPVALMLCGAWLAVLYLGKLVIAIALGKMLLNRKPEAALNEPALLWPMVLGIVVACLIFSIPILGWVLSLVATVWGAGAIWLYGKEKSCAHHQQ